jgi:hypothetical protein
MRTATPPRGDGETHLLATQNPNGVPRIHSTRERPKRAPTRETSGGELQKEREVESNEKREAESDEEGDVESNKGSGMK